MYIVSDDLDKYADEHSQKLNPVLEELIQETKEKTNLSQMLSSRASGTLLKMLVKMTKPNLIVEIGMFTGFSALCMAEGLCENGKIISCELDETYAKIAQKYFNKHSSGEKIEIKLGDAKETLQHLEQPIDFAFIDADKTGYINYYHLVMERLTPGGIIVIDNALLLGTVLHPENEDAKVVNSLNQIIKEDPRVDNVLLTVKDGMHIVYKK